MTDAIEVVNGDDKYVIACTYESTEYYLAGITDETKQSVWSTDIDEASVMPTLNKANVAFLLVIKVEGTKDKSFRLIHRGANGNVEIKYVAAT